MQPIITTLMILLCLSVCNAIQGNPQSSNSKARLHSPIACACKSLGYPVMGGDSCTLVDQPRVPHNLLAATCWMGLAASAQAMPLDTAVSTPLQVIQQSASKAVKLPLTPQQQYAKEYLIKNDIVLPSTLQAAVTETQSTSEAAPSSLARQAGLWAFLAYVVVSLAAGFKELGVRIQKWMKNRSDS
jgi:hypothetical protein